MRTRTKLAATFLALLTATSSLRAGNLDPKYVPADAKWVLHVDLDAVTKSKMLAMLNVDIKLTGDGKHFLVGMRPEGMSDNDVKKIAAIQDALGMRFPDDIHGLTLVGQNFDEKGVVLIVKAKVDKDRLIGMAKLSPGYTSKMYNGLEVITWKANKEDADDEAVSGAFLADDAVVIARTAAEVQHAIDAASDKDAAHVSPLLKSSNNISGGVVMVYAAADGLGELPNIADLSPIIAPVKTVRASIGERDDDIVLKGELSVKTAEAARQVRGALEGIRALATLASLDNGGDKEAKMASQLATRATVNVNDTTVTVDWPVAMTTIRGLVKPEEAHSATTKPAAESAKEPQ